MRGKIYSRTEADRILPLVRRLVIYVRARQRLIQRKQLELARLFSAGEGTSERARAIEATCKKLRLDIDGYARELEGLGAFLRDPETGIVEVYAEIDRRIVYLTWEPPARRFEWFHALESNHVARVRLPDVPETRLRSATESH